MFVGNVLNQNYIFHYRVSGRNGMTTQVISKGEQVKLSGDLTPDDMEGIILQHQPYGFIDASAPNLGKFGGIIYSIGKPIPEDKMKRAYLKYQEQVHILGKEIRKEAAVSVSDQIDKDIIGEHNPAMKLTNLEMSVEEIAPRGGLQEDRELFNEGLQVFKGEGEIPLPLTRRERAR